MSCTNVVHDAYAATPIDCLTASTGTTDAWPFVAGAIALIVLVSLAYGWHQSRT